MKKFQKNITLRLTIWEKYYQKIIDDKKILILGDKEREMDKIYQSAQFISRYYLQVWINSGFAIFISFYFFLFC